MAISPVTSVFHNLVIQDLKCMVLKRLACFQQQPEVLKVVLSPTTCVFLKESLSLKMATCKQRATTATTQKPGSPTPPGQSRKQHLFHGWKNEPLLPSKFQEFFFVTRS